MLPEAARMMPAAADRRPVLIMAGGTGGHVFPALAVADELSARGVPVSWLGTRRGLEARVVPAAGYTLSSIRVSGLRGKGLLRRLFAPFMLALAVFQSLVILLRLRPGSVLGMGGFASGPGGLVAWLLRCPLVIHEQNSVAGLTNRLLAPLARHVLEAFPGSLPAARHAIHTGNPVRSAIAALPDPTQRLSGHAGALRLLVIGGSLGARALNQVVPQAVARLPLNDRPLIHHQTGPADEADVREHYRELDNEARVEAFVEDMAAAYTWADLVVCRAGALTVAELCAAGVASILVPFPYATDDHQTGNARYLADAGAAVLVPQSELTEERLAQLLAGYSADREALLEMACRARELARPEAARQVAGFCLEAAGQAPLPDAAGGAA
jgi:UDP-N-acetylglucosamine--N-acetylmuramyl-(pentapeptide) pyrophosphoryl-undecaprenol N-acetylglucosamine transferase